MGTKKAYKERFPKCQHPVNIIHSDGRQDSRCPNDVSGGYNQTCKDGQYGEYCFQCPYYKERTTPIVDISSDDEGDYMIYALYHMNKEDWENRFGKMKEAI